ncbi:hypothetical protein [Brevundimonas sp.]|uniref:hypothetical protein n=1 Tax=Brevundimonas sp. TaxID=1871086 RepID=UPI00257C5829|nr:hypothetical protein [Brevundimonas sp.]
MKYGHSTLAGLAALALLGVAGCATAPATYDVKNSEVIPASQDVVWERIVGFFATNNLSIKTIEKASGIIAAERIVGSPAVGGKILGWADCGANALATARSQSIDLNVFVRPQAAGTSVTVNTHFTEGRYNALTEAPETVSCNSTGALESAILAVAAGS